MKKRKLPLVPLSLIVLTVVLGIASGPISNAIELPVSIKPLALPLLLCLAFALGLIAVIQYFLQEKDAPPLPASNSQNRQRLIERVHAFWIIGVFEQSLHNVVLITLGLYE